MTSGGVHVVRLFEDDRAGTQVGHCNNTGPLQIIIQLYGGIWGQGITINVTALIWY